MAFVVGVGLVSGTAAAVAGYLNITTTAERHTQTLEAHSHALEKLETVTHDLNSKLDAILWQSGVNPATVVKEAAAAKANDSRP